MKKNHIIILVSLIVIAIVAYFLFFRKKPAAQGAKIQIVTPPAGTPLPAGESNFTIDRVSPKDYYESISNSGWKPFGY